MMEVSAPGRRLGSRNYTQEFREMVVAQANDPARSIADVAQEHGLNANMVVNLYRALWKEEGKQIEESHAEEAKHTALSTVSTEPKTCKEAGKLWKAFEALQGDSGLLDGSRLDTFARFFSDPGAVRERLQVWERDRHQQPHPNYGTLRLEPAWLDFLDVDLTLGPDEPLPYIVVPPWNDNVDTTTAGATAS